MDSEIEFGQIEHSQPDTAVRPDQDKHYVVRACGDVEQNDLPIFVDLDVLRDMESHARENTRVELGGVMLGRQFVDADGQPFVVITDSLRARHYEATKGSFKFTHDTWNQITKERNEFQAELQMVGWYHTHPGWGVFLSGMDMFICRNFFNRPLDVALVIDPCAGDRGWFQWTTEDPDKTRQTAGFYLMTNRHRAGELNYFTEQFSQEQTNLVDPRFRQVPFAANPSHQVEDTMVHHHDDSRRAIHDVAIVSMLFLQLLVVGLIGWRLTATPAVAENDADAAKELAAVVERLNDQEKLRLSSVREQAYAEVLDTLVNRETGQAGLVEKFADIAQTNRLLNENLEGQLSRVHQTAAEKAQVEADLRSEQLRSKKLVANLTVAKQNLAAAEKDRDALKTQLDPQDSAEASWLAPWMVYSLAGLGMLLVGGVGGYFMRSAIEEREDLDDDSTVRRSDAAPTKSAEATRVDGADEMSFNEEAANAKTVARR